MTTYEGIRSTTARLALFDVRKRLPPNRWQDLVEESLRKDFITKARRVNSESESMDAAKPPMNLTQLHERVTQVAAEWVCRPTRACSQATHGDRSGTLKSTSTP